jgi:hypothetical protein
MKIVGLVAVYVDERTDAHYVAAILAEWAVTGAGYGSHLHSQLARIPTALDRPF